MKLPAARSAPPHPGRSYLPVPLLTRTGTGPEAADVLHEIGGEPGVLLWSTLRDVMGYLATPRSRRAELFPAGSGAARRAEIAAARVDAALWGPLLVVAEMLDAPEGASRTRVAHACRAIARWAEGGAPATRLAFAQAAALARPGDPKLALSTARLARETADYARAETWFRRAVKLARGKDWESYVRAFLGLGVMYHRGGNYPAAAVVAGRALRAARRRRLGAIEGEAHHDLMLIATEGKRRVDAYNHARAALEAFGPRHRRLPYLAHDVACCWTDEGRYDLALPVFVQLVPAFTSPAERTQVLANAAHAAGGSGARAEYEEYRSAVITAIRATPGEVTWEANLLLAIARADNLMGEWRRAEAAARRAIERATRRGENQIRLLAEAQHEIAVRRQVSDAHSMSSELLAREAAGLAGQLARTLELRAMAGAGA